MGVCQRLDHNMNYVLEWSHLSLFPSSYAPKRQHQFFHAQENSIIIILIDRSPCPDDVRIIGRWRPTLCTEAKETLDSVPIQLSVLLCIRCCFHISGSFRTSILLPPHLFLQPIFFCLRLCLHLRLHRLPCPCQVNSRLFPLPHPHLCPLLPLRRLTQVQNRSRLNILREHILTSTNVGLHRLKPRLHSHRLCTWQCLSPAHVGNAIR